MIPQNHLFFPSVEVGVDGDTVFEYTECEFAPLTDFYVVSRAQRRTKHRLSEIRIKKMKSGGSNKNLQSLSW